MEAADDIAYCMSDIADGLEKRMISCQEFLNAFEDCWKQNYPNEKSPLNKAKPDFNFNREVSIFWSREAMKVVTNNYIK